MICCAHTGCQTHQFKTQQTDQASVLPTSQSQDLGGIVLSELSVLKSVAGAILVNSIPQRRLEGVSPNVAQTFTLAQGRTG